MSNHFVACKWISCKTAPNSIKCMLQSCSCKKYHPTRCPKKKCELLLLLQVVIHTFFGTLCIFTFKETVFIEDCFDPFQHSNKGRLQIKKNCIFYDIWQKGRGSKDQNQPSLKKRNWNFEKFVQGLGENI